MDLEYLRARFPREVKLLGKKLRTFTLGHLIFLQWIGNKFVCPGGRPGFEDLVSGIFVCSRSHEAAERQLRSNWLGLRLTVWGWFCRGSNWQEKMLVFAQYLQEGSSYPMMPDPSEDMRIPGAPLVQRVLITLRGRLHMTHREALEYPWGLAHHDYFAIAEMDDKAKLVNHEEDEQLEEAERDAAAFDQALKEGKLGHILGDKPWVSFPS